MIGQDHAIPTRGGEQTRGGAGAPPRTVPRDSGPEPRRILIVKPSSLGDVVTAVGVLRGLRRAFPDVHIAWLVASAYAPLLEGDPDLGECITFDRRRLGAFWRSRGALGDLRRLLRRLRKGEFDWAIDLQGLFRSGFFTRATRAPLRAGFADAREGATIFYNRAVAVAAPHTVDRNRELLAALGVEVRPEDMCLTVRPEAQAFAEEFCRASGLAGEDYVVCVPFTRGAIKNYPPRRWREVVEGLSRRGPVVLLGAPSERRASVPIAAGLEGTVHNLVGQTTIPQMVAMIAAAAGVVCGDSAAKFLAPAVGTPAVVLIGPTRVERTGPYLQGRAIVADVPCQGCLKRSCRHVTCMESIPPQAVLAAAGALLPCR
jgi:lipopolysaccharide heptosyltransferase I